MEDLDPGDDIEEEDEDIEEDITASSSVPMNPSDLVVLKFADNRPGESHISHVIDACKFFYKSANCDLIQSCLSKSVCGVVI